ncbi:MAG: hypothetical protein ACE5LU_23785 [Anaerolineae bacterium]
MNQQTSRTHLPFMALGMLALLAGLWAGLIRLGWALPVWQPALSIVHGPLMVSGFLGTLITLERAVALVALGWGSGRVSLLGQSTGADEASPDLRWTYAAPLLSGLGALTLVLGLPGLPGPLLITLGSLGLVAMFILIVRRQPALFTTIMALGAVAWLVGNALWLAGRPLFGVVPWWGGFLVLTIAGERLELARLLRLTGAGRAAFLAAVGLFLAGLILTQVTFDVGIRLAGGGMLALALWLLRHDIARRTVRQEGLTRFIGVCLLSGYIWLGVSGLLGLAFGGVAAGSRYDVMLHALFLGFVFSMILGHAPIIFPAILKRPMAFRSAFYVHLALLHVSLLLRVAGDLTGWLPARQWGGLLNVVALLLFLANTVRSVGETSPPGAQAPG